MIEIIMISYPIAKPTKRNITDNGYCALEATSLYLQHRINCHPKRKLDNPKLYRRVKSLFFNHQYSPEVINKPPKKYLG